MNVPGNENTNICCSRITNETNNTSSVPGCHSWIWIHILSAYYAPWERKDQLSSYWNDDDDDNNTSLKLDEYFTTTTTTTTKHPYNVDPDGFHHTTNVVPLLTRDVSPHVFAMLLARTIQENDVYHKNEKSTFVVNDNTVGSRDYQLLDKHRGKCEQDHPLDHFTIPKSGCDKLESNRSDEYCSCYCNLGDGDSRNSNKYIVPFRAVLGSGNNRRVRTEVPIFGDKHDCNEYGENSTKKYNNSNSTNNQPTSFTKTTLLFGDTSTTSTRKKVTSMNEIFGDPAPGLSKRLHIRYTVSQPHDNDDDDQFCSHWCRHGSCERKIPRYKTKHRRHNLPTQHHYASFAEHERPVCLKLNLQMEQPQQQKNEYPSMSRESKRRMLDPIVNNILAETLQPNDSMAATFCSSGSKCNNTPKDNMHQESHAYYSSPINILFGEALTLILPLLTLRDRVQCRLVCREWHNIIQERGITSVIDDSDTTTFPPMHSKKRHRIVQGMLLHHSYCSLLSLCLNNTPDIMPREDLHMAIPHLCKLRFIDISRCTQFDDETMFLLASHTNTTLEVLYMKGLHDVSDKGVIAIAQSCSNLEVLDLSYIPITDAGGIEIGLNLHKLKALFLRDNFFLTNRSIDVITINCIHLEQLTLWGCYELRHLCFKSNVKIDGSDVTICENNCVSTSFRPDKNYDVQPSTNFVATSLTTSNSGVIPSMVLSGISQTPTRNYESNLIVLNLWGCHGLLNDTANRLMGMRNLKSLILSECHNLTDEFVVPIVKMLQQLNHLHLAYCKRITDLSVYTISEYSHNLFSLDISFCSRITLSSICALLDQRRHSLAELRLYNCYNLGSQFSTNNFSPDVQNFHINQPYNLLSLSSLPLSSSPLHAGPRIHDYRNQLNTNNYARRLGLIHILHILQSNCNTCCLSVLDLRNCGMLDNNDNNRSSTTNHYHHQQQRHNDNNNINNNNSMEASLNHYCDDNYQSFVQGMKELQFQSKVPGYFVRPARWNSTL